MKNHFTLIRMVVVEKKTKNSLGEDVEKLEHGALRNVKWCSYYRKHYGGS